METDRINIPLLGHADVLAKALSLEVPDGIVIRVSHKILDPCADTIE